MLVYRHFRRNVSEGAALKARRFAVVVTYVLCCVLMTEAQSVAKVNTDQELLTALTASSVTTIVLENDVKMEQKVWDQMASKYNITRNITITSKDSASWPLLDFNFMQSKVTINPGVTVNLEHILGKNTRHGPGVVMDFFGYSPGGVIQFTHFVKWQLACTHMTLATVTGLPVAKGWPGPQVVQILDNFCVGKRCWKEVLFYEHYALQTTHILDDFSDTGGYVIAKRDSKKVCDVFVSPECVRESGADKCVLDAMDRLMKARSDDTVKMAVGIAVGLGGAVLVAVAAALVARRWRRGGINWGKMGGRNLDLEEGFVERPSGDCTLMGNLLVLPATVKASTRLQPLVGAGHKEVTVELGAVIGSGSFGRVFEGTIGGREIAVKVVTHSAAALNRVVSEVELMLPLLHPNIARAYHYLHISNPSTQSPPISCNLSQPGSMDDSAERIGALHRGCDSSGGLKSSSGGGSVQTLILMELCDKGSLAGAISGGRFHRGPLPLMHPILLRLCDVATGMAHLHSRSICHGDLKAANILLSTNKDDPYESIAKVADFGLSRALDSGQTHLSTRTMGTVTHMPPELLKNGQLAPPGDVFAFGIIMWEIATAKMPYAGMMHGEVIAAVLVANTRPEFPPYIPPAYVQLAKDCWQATPSTRPPFTEVLEQLQEMLAEWQQLQQHCEEVAAGCDGGVAAIAKTL